MATVDGIPALVVKQYESALRTRTMYASGAKLTWASFGVFTAVTAFSAAVWCLNRKSGNADAEKNTKAVSGTQIALSAFGNLATLALAVAFQVLANKAADKCAQLERLYPQLAQRQYNDWCVKWAAP